MINRYQTLWLGGGPKVSIPVSQYDTMWRFIFTVINGSVEWTIPTGATAVLNGRKPDGNVIAISGAIADNKVTVDATEQMTVVAGEVVCELSIMSGGAVVGTANFTLAVEDAPKKDGEPISESDLSAYAEMIAAAGELVEEAREIIEQGPFLPSGGTPGQVLTKTATGETWDDVSGLPDGGSNGQVLTRTSSGAAWSDAGTPTQAQTDSAVADWLDEHPEATTTVQDGSITEAKLNALLAAKINNAFSTGAKNALLALLEKVAYIDTDGQTYLDALQNELFPPANLVSITAVFTQGSATIYDTDSLDTLKQYLTVTANYDNGTSVTVTNYTLSGTLTEGTSTITVSYSGKTATFDVVVSTVQNLFDPANDPSVNMYINAQNMVVRTPTVTDTTVYASSYISVEPNSTYTITKTPTNQFRVGTTATIPANNVTVLQTEANHTGNTITITTAATAHYLFFTYWYSSGDYNEQEVRNSIFVEKVA